MLGLFGKQYKTQQLPNHFLSGSAQNWIGFEISSCVISLSWRNINIFGFEGETDCNHNNKEKTKKMGVTKNKRNLFDFGYIEDELEWV